MASDVREEQQRQYLPAERRTIEYEGSRPLGSKFGDVIYSGPGPF